MPKVLRFDHLSPGALRLLLAYLTQEEGEPFEVTAERSGIHDLQTFFSSRRQLLASGFLIRRDGREYTTLHEQELDPEPPTTPTIYPYRMISRITKATQ